MAKFELISKFADSGLPVPERKTASSAGYDFVVAEDILVPSIWTLMPMMKEYTAPLTLTSHYSLDEIANITKITGAKPTLVPTGMKCQLDIGTYLELSVRSSCPLKYWLIMANGVGVIDRDYYNNPDNEGHIYFQLINLSPYNIMLKQGDCIGQGIIKPYIITSDDQAIGERVGGFGSTSV